MNYLTGACAEYIEYIDGYADYKNGVVCHAVLTDSADATAIATAGNYIFLIPKGNWTSGGATLSTLAVEDIAATKLTD